MRFLLYILFASFYIINPTQVNAGMLPVTLGKAVSNPVTEQSSIKKDKLSQKQFAALTAVPQTGINYSSYRYHPFEKFFLEEEQFVKYKASFQKVVYPDAFRLNQPIGLLLLFPHHYFW